MTDQSVQPVYVCFSMDCEIVGGAQGGPSDWDLSERAIRGYAEAVIEAGLGVSLFIMPQTAERHRSLFEELAELGAELAMHYHPQDFGHPEFLGAYTASEQKEMLGEAAERWRQALGSEPAAFRPGNVSANDATFQTLVELGFRRGSCSVPRRNFPGVRAVWAGSPLDPYRVHPANRHIPGDLEFIEIPITVDWESILWGGLTPLELRVEMVDGRAHGFTIRKVYDRLNQDVPMVKCLMAITHNVFDYSDPRDFRRETLEEMIRRAREDAPARGLEARPGTTTQIAEAYQTGEADGAQRLGSV